MLNQDGQLSNIDISKASDYKCELENCKCSTFTVKYKIKKMSALVSPNGQEVMIPIQVFACDLCGHVNKDFEQGELS